VFRSIDRSHVYSFLVALLGISFAHYALLEHDTGAFFAYAERVAVGGKLYVDVNEVNTPLVTYALLPLVKLRDATGIAYTDSFFIIYGLIFFACALFSLKLLSFIEEFRRPASKTLAGIAISYILILSVAMDISFGQREHFLICLIFPYIVTLMARDYKADIPKKYRLIAGVIAAAGFCVKPNFIVIFICAELVSLVRERRLMSCFRPETIAISSIFTVYHIWFVYAFPEYFIQLPYFIDAYKSFQSDFFLTVAKMVFGLSGFYFYIVLVIKLKSDLSKITLLLAVSAGSCIHYAIQNAGFNYHLIPAYAFMIWIGVVLLINANKSKYVIVLILLTMFPYSPKVLDLAERRESILSMSNKIIANAESGEVAILSTSVFPAFPVVNYAETFWPLSSAHLRQLPVSYDHSKIHDTEPNYRSLAEMNETERYFTSRNLGELEKRPKLIVIDEREHKQGLDNVKFNILNYFLTQERFRALWKDYRYIGTLHDFAFYKYEPAAKP
jgi:hypothetical protein